MATKGGKAGKAVKKRTHKLSGYYDRQKTITEMNRKRKWRRHLREHPNNIKGMERIRKLLNIE